MRLQQIILLVAIASTFAPVLAVQFRGGGHRALKLMTLLGAIAMSVHLALVLVVFQQGPRSEPTSWVHALLASAVPVLLAVYAFSVSLGRNHPEESLRKSRRTFILLSVVGMGFLTMIGQETFLAGFDWNDGRATIHLGSLGKFYVSYLLIGIVLVGHSLERTYRVASTDLRYRMRMSLLGIFANLSFFTFILATGLLYSAIGLGKLIAAGMPIIFASLAIAHGYVRRAIADVSAPVSRGIVYSSFTALAAGLFVLSIGLAAQVATWTHWSPDEVLSVAIGFLVILGAGLLFWSNRFQRMMRQFVDRNFYVNRYDYRTQWTNITEAIEQSRDERALLTHSTDFLRDVFAADGVTIGLCEGGSDCIRVLHGKGAANQAPILKSDSPLYELLQREGKALLLDRKPHDFTYIPIYAEDGDWLDATASQMISPLLDGDTLVGLVGLERRDRNDQFTFEDVALFESMSTHVASALRSLRLARELADAREAELVSQWSSMILHDLKNYLAPLRLAATNLTEGRDEPEVVTACAVDIEQVAERMNGLVLTLSELRESPQLGSERVCPNTLIQDTLSALRVSAREGIEVDLNLDAEQQVLGDRKMLQRVLENLVTNAIDAMVGQGRLTMSTVECSSGAEQRVHIRVTDTGPGISEGFAREHLFRPFATTKKGGLGLGLYQCRLIVRAHGGELSMTCTPGKGTAFLVDLGAASSEARTTEMIKPQDASKKVAP